MNDAPSLDFIQYIVKYMNKFDDDANDASHGETMVDVLATKMAMMTTS